ncbi:hypothetical protein [Clostridium frigidicarnis]|uniref:Uncharacterized protein n=1 Tax=Clostridium frigidicarnis TaxID=84698 RepID=A0A1I0VTQ8_9CLOT|nr:hypothetical protein [Clostridium frigidicarnis]SFA79417.1 hypothetical protein SAMN04488528_10033 [Clostridium frigidicarnis]
MRNNYDEMQEQMRNKIGNETFSLIAPKQNIPLNLGKDIVIMLLSMSVVTIIAHFFENKETSAPVDNNMGLILNVLSIGVFIILAIISIVKNIYDNKHIN